MTPAPVRDCAYAAGVQPGTLRIWVLRGHISPPVGGMYDLDEILEWSDRRSHRHAVSARHQRHTERVRCKSAGVV